MAIPLLAVAGGMAAAGLIGSAVAGASGVGKNTFRAGGFDQTGAYNANRFEYGGAAGQANADANRYAHWANAAQFRQGAQADYGRAQGLTGRAVRWDEYGGAAREAQGAAAGLMYSRATGATPSIAGMQARQDMQRAQAAQAAQAASARGAAGLALAQQNAANNTANAQAQISNQAQINAATERMQAEQAAFNAYSGMRSGDVAQSAQMGALAQSEAQQAQYNAALQQQQRALNDQMSLGMSQHEIATKQSQLNANMQQQQLMAQSYGMANQLNAGANQANADREMGYFKAGLGAVSGGAGMLVPGKADGGPVEAGKPYVVGERGPELIIPADRGLVIPNHALRDPAFVRGPQGEDYGHRTAQYSMDAALAEMEAKRREMKRDEQNTAKTFSRDSAAQQQAVREAYFAGLAAQADRQIAGYRSALGQGASVALNEGEIDQAAPGIPPAWLTQYMAEQQPAQPRLALVAPRGGGT